MSIEKSFFGKLLDGRDVTCFKITDTTGAEAEILDYGVTLRTLKVLNKNNTLTDVVLGYDTIEEYINNDGYFGATVGRFANRIRDGKFTLNGQEYNLATNDGPNHLHGGNIGFDKYIWDSKELENGIEFSIISPDEDEGYPGNLKVTVTITLVNSELKINYCAVSNKDTIINLTNHSYFNLNGGKGTICEHHLTVNADEFTINDANGLPTGEIVSVENTAMDFHTEKTIGERINSDDISVKLFEGYDSNFVLNSNTAAIVRSTDSGIVMTVYTDQPGMQLYTANKTSERKGKNGLRYGKHSAFCMETQHYPDCVNHPEWPTCVLKAGEEFKSYTTYSFSVDSK